MIIACDFDGCISNAPFPHVGNPNIQLINQLIRCRKNGDRLILWTMREGQALDLAVKFCKGFGLCFDAVNDNLPETKDRWQNNPRKVYADIYIDDHGMNIKEYTKRYCEKRKGSVRGIRVRG